MIARYGYKCTVKKSFPKRRIRKQKVDDAFLNEALTCNEQKQTNDDAFLQKALISNNEEITFSLSSEKAKYGTLELQDGQETVTVAIPKAKKILKKIFRKKV